MTQQVKNPPAMQKTQKTFVQSLGWEDLLEEEMATHSSILAQKIPWTEEPARIQYMGLQRVGHDLLTKQKKQQYSILIYYTIQIVIPFCTLYPCILFFFMSTTLSILISSYPACRQPLLNDSQQFILNVNESVSGFFFVCLFFNIKSFHFLDSTVK